MLGHGPGVRVLGEAVFTRLRKRGVRIQGRRYEVDAYEEVRPDANCSLCCGWGHIGPQYTAAAPRCTFCEESQTTAGHRCPVESRPAGRGHTCPHGVGKEIREPLV